MTDASLGSWPEHCCRRLDLVLLPDGTSAATCDVCGERITFASHDEENPDTDITIADLLEDAAQVLRDTGKPSLARAVKIARVLAGGEPGEVWIRDVVEVVAQAEDVIDAARTNPDRVVLDGLARSLEQCASWGLKAGDRTRAALREIIATITSIEGVLSDTELEAEDRIKIVSEHVSSLLALLGFKQR